MTTSIQPSAFTTPLVAGDVTFTNNLSPDAMMIYLQTRLDGLDAQVDTIFNDQKRQQQAQSILRNIQTDLAPLNDKNADPVTLVEAHQDPPTSDSEGNPVQADPTYTDGPVKVNVARHLAELRELDPKLADVIENKLHEGDQLFGTKNPTGTHVAAAKSYLDGIGKDLESAAQMNMIHLQSIMSARQTAVQLATNLVSSLGESTKAIVSNLGR